ncbi:MAG: NAD-dependent epimerase/dehydratase family protein [Patescibacteria group bacterium]|nr:NAD-dependent epimerase/dehydratase family protein [Patescibacteria group bacterium]MDD5491016.1 NAD-dependent epimerase/dehydratase family protein [Patescibacteria group bacterium]
MKNIIVTGATGQIGSELVIELRKRYGEQNVVAVGHSRPIAGELAVGPFEIVDVTNKIALDELVKKYQPDAVFHLVGILSAAGEKNPELAWNVNMGGLKNVLDIARDRGIKKVFWPSSIAAFGPTTPRDNTPQHTVLEPTTMYGVTKVAGELLCQYYWKKYGLDVRSLRYPGLISYKTPPGGGTTDYAVAIYFEAVKNKKYDCFVGPDTVLPMMYMPDAVRATIELMEAPAENIKIRTSYNLTALSFSAEELAQMVANHVPGFTCVYHPDDRQKIADSWPRSIDDSSARADWKWNHTFDLEKMTKDMLNNIK